MSAQETCFTSVVQKAASIGNALDRIEKKSRLILDVFRREAVEPNGDQPPLDLSLPTVLSGIEDTTIILEKILSEIYYELTGA